MTLAHELCHLLFDRSDAVPLSVLSGAWAPPRLERVANAFAAELLMPLEGTHDVVGWLMSEPTEDELKRLMDRFEVGVTTALEHCLNRFFLR